MKLLKKLKEGYLKAISENHSPEQETEERRKNFLKKKRILNYQMHDDENQEEEGSGEKNKYEEDPIIKNKAPSHSPINDLGELRKPVHHKLAPLDLGHKDEENEGKQGMQV